MADFVKSYKLLIDLCQNHLSKHSNEFTGRMQDLSALLDKRLVCLIIT